ncbi:MAG: nucleotidyl transferase AbiEii/AbiGii toxin family protein [Candidatus Bipolaricaulota bacterium]|nr:nucleotidyl transferase AbiEii/AbiGii toxin family protein [Candidatus Bipolaricaulota bacterium]
MRKNELKRLAGKEKIPLGALEKDYVISILLEVISSLPYSSSLIFKGGTCIKKIYFPDARFSVDLDFSCLEDVTYKLAANLKSSLANKRIRDVGFNDVVEEERRGDSVRLGVKYHDVNGHPTSIKIDLSLREKPLKLPKPREVLNLHYSDIPACTIMALSLDEILAEKVRAVIARQAPRDIYDIWYLLRKGAKLNQDMLNKKLELLKRDKIFTLELFKQRLDKKKEGWKRDLVMLVPKAPNFVQVKEKILEMIAGDD